MSFNPKYSEKAPVPEEISQFKGSALLEFGAPWCGYCQAAETLIERAMLGFPDLKHIKIYDGKGKKLGRHFGVKLWPTLIVLKDGKEVGRLVRPESTGEVERLLLSTK